MADEKTNSRIVLSRHTLAKFEQATADLDSQTIDLVLEEIAILQGIVKDNPEKAISVGDLVKRWQAMAEQLRGKVH